MAKPRAGSVTEDWRNINKTWEEKLTHIYRCGYGTDITIKICEDKNEKSFKAHRFVLSMSSEVFDTMLKAPVFRNPGDAILMLVNVNAEAFAQFLEYVYCKKFQLSSTKNAIALHKIADKFNVLDLKLECAKYVDENLTVDNVMECCEYADMYKLDDLKQRCNELIQNNTASVLNENNMHTWKMEWIVLVLEQPKLSIKEPELFRLIHKWVNTCSDNDCLKGKMYDCLVTKFCFLNFSGDEFVAGPVKSGMLTKNQSLAVLGHIVADENCHLDYPDNFNKTIRQYVEGGAEKTGSKMQTPKISKESAVLSARGSNTSKK
ncbi:kelch-like protein 35 [Cimex lectularius]|uniref:BTB domain-containing protein n=1 Tax=Cimex lectularius TaxID=79782 RepID=A0A8I6TG82_CIMLE|nr:kelch-like protein 35 [Cimex lectularius]